MTPEWKWILRSLQKAGVILMLCPFISYGLGFVGADIYDRLTSLLGAFIFILVDDL